MKKAILALIILLFIIPSLKSQIGGDISNILPLRQQIELYNKNLGGKLIAYFLK